METICTGCNVALAGSDVLYTSAGKPVCLACYVGGAVGLAVPAIQLVVLDDVIGGTASP